MVEPKSSVLLMVSPLLSLNLKLSERLSSSRERISPQLNTHKTGPTQTHKYTHSPKRRARTHTRPSEAAVVQSGPRGCSSTRCENTRSTISLYSPVGRSSGKEGTRVSGDRRGQYSWVGNGRRGIVKTASQSRAELNTQTKVIFPAARTELLLHTRIKVEIGNGDFLQASLITISRRGIIKSAKGKVEENTHQLPKFWI